ncbi:MAG: hypothetical protein ACKO2M_03945, partial [Actinomycetota bacterium]
MFPAELSLEVATIDDGKDLAEIMSLADQFFTPGAEIVGLTEAEEILNGYIDSVEAANIGLPHIPKTEFHLTRFIQHYGL